VIDGLVLTFIETTKQKQAEQDSHEAHVYMDRIGSALREPILALDEHAQVVSANPALYRMFQLSEETVLGKHLCEVGAGTWDVPALRQLLAQIQGEEETLENFRLEHMFPRLGHKVLLFNARKIKRTSKLPELILLAIEDITRPQTPGSSRGSSSKNRRVKDSAQD
jgi:two-component system CheB/CheR fusion protein